MSGQILTTGPQGSYFTITTHCTLWKISSTNEFRSRFSTSQETKQFGATADYRFVQQAESALDVRIIFGFKHQVLLFATFIVILSTNVKMQGIYNRK